MFNKLSGYHKQLINDIKSKGYLRTDDYINAFRKIQRHKFLPSFYRYEDSELKQYFREDYIKNNELLEYIYADRSVVFHAENGMDVSSMSSPSLIAEMIEQIEPAKGHKIFEVGTGSGYNIALLSEIVGKTGHVFSCEINEDIHSIAKQNLRENGYERENVYISRCDGGYGIEDFAPYDAIFVTCATADITKYWIDQLKIGGTIIAPLITRGMEVLVRLKKTREKYLEGRLLHYVHFYHLKGKFSILTHYSYTKKELNTLHKIINQYAVIDEDFSDKIADFSDREINDFFLFLSLNNKRGICYFLQDADSVKRGYGIFLKTTKSSGIAILIDRKLHIWGNPEAHNMFIREFSRFKDRGYPDIDDYSLKVYSDANEYYSSPGDYVISRKNSVTVFEQKDGK